MSHELSHTCTHPSPNSLIFMEFGVKAWEYPSLADYNPAMHRPFLLHAMRELGSQWQVFFSPIYQRGALCPSPTEL